MAKTLNKHLALLRGINVGGKNLFSKDELQGCFRDFGFTGVRTYIQSGNVLFKSEEARIGELTALVERGLSERFSYEARAVVLSSRKYAAAMRAAPAGWGEDDSRRHNALFTLKGVTPRKVLGEIPPPKPGIETISAGPGVLFWSVSKEQATRATYSRLAKEPVYQSLTIRNHNTSLKLLELLKEL